MWLCLFHLLHGAFMLHLIACKSKKRARKQDSSNNRDPNGSSGSRGRSPAKKTDSNTEKKNADPNKRSPTGKNGTQGVAPVNGESPLTLEPTQFFDVNEKTLVSKKSVMKTSAEGKPRTRNSTPEARPSKSPIASVHNSAHVEPTQQKTISKQELESENETEDDTFRYVKSIRDLKPTC